MVSIGASQPWTARNPNDGAQAAALYSASRELSFGEKARHSVESWGTRIAAGELGDRYISGSSPAVELGAERIARLYGDKTPMHYRDILGIGNEKLTLEPGHRWQGFRDLVGTSEGHKTWGAAIKRNFKNFLGEEGLKDVSAKTLTRETVVAGNLHSLVEPLKAGQYATGAARILGVGMMLWQVGEKTLRAYHYAKDQGWSPLKTAGYTLMHFLGQSTKSLACWELGTVGYALGAALLPIAGAPAIIAGLAAGAIFGALGYKGLSKIIPDPPHRVTDQDAQPDGKPAHA